MVNYMSKIWFCWLHSMHSGHLTFCMFASIVPLIHLWPFSDSTPRRVGLQIAPRLRTCEKDFDCLALWLQPDLELRVSWSQLFRYQLILVAERFAPGSTAQLQSHWQLCHQLSLHHLSLFWALWCLNLISCVFETILVPKDQLISDLKDDHLCISSGHRFIHTCVRWPTQFIPGMAKENPHIPLEDEASETYCRICFESDCVLAGQCMEVGRRVWLDKGWRWPSVWQSRFHVGHSMSVWRSYQDAPGFWCLLQLV